MILDQPLEIVWDMETGDPDDFLTLIFLLGHPFVDLKAITITPGGADQVAVVKWALQLFKREDIPVGTFREPAAQADLDMKNKGQVPSRVSGWHYRAYNIPRDLRDYSAEVGWKLLDRTLDRGLDKTTTMITGAPLRNLGRLMREMSIRLYDRTPNLGRLFIQGGFAGVGVVPEEDILPKFEGMTTCPTYNLNGDPKAVFRILEHRHWWQEMRFISKNVCHGIYYDAEMHQLVNDTLYEALPHDSPFRDPKVRVADYDDALEAAGSRWHLSMMMIWQGMDAYIKKTPEGKKFHDPLAAVCALDSSIARWAEVEIYREKGQWGSRLDDTTGIHIITGVDKERFQEAIIGYDPEVGGIWRRLGPE